MLHRKLFWIQRGSNPRIESSNLDGSDRRLLHNTQISWPEDITVEHIRGAIFWTDSKLRTIETSFEDGSGRRVIAKYGKLDIILVFCNEYIFDIHVFSIWLVDCHFHNIKAYDPL